MPDEQHDHRADHRADQSGALVEAVPSDGLAEERHDECSGDAEQRGQDEAGRVVRAGSEQARDHARNETYDDDPKDVHGLLREAGLRDQLWSPPQVPAAYPRAAPTSIRCTYAG